MTLAHDVTGSGPAVLLLHSTVCDRRMWDPQVPVLVAAGRRVVRCDLFGYGDSPVPTGPYDQARDVVDLLGAERSDLVGASGGGQVEALGAERFDLVGASGGGQVALEIAARWPERVGSLALLCTAMRGHEPSAELRAFGEREDALLAAGDVEGATELNVGTWVGPEAGPDVRDRVRVMQRHAFEVQLAATEDPESLSADPDLGRISARTLLVSGAHDLPDFREIAVHLARVLPDARHVELAWAGHLPSLERPDLLNPLLLELLTP